MGHNNPGRARREIARDNERLSKMTPEERQRERDAEELYHVKATARNDAYRSFSAEEIAIYEKVKDALYAAEDRASNAWNWDKQFGGTGKQNPWRKEE
ncbi:hypothetical protein [Bradyrhizobium elkanii]|uniref:hypothetical protein n=2 Tax=Bradyrhizobium elkanii TaxID=29448 RepID=UPI0035155439